MHRPLFLVCVMIALVSCAPALSPTPTPAPLPYLAVTPALQPWFEARASAFVSEEGALDFFPLLRQPGEIQDALQSGEAQLAIAGTEAPPEGFITPLGDEAIAVITHPANPLTSLSSEEISRIFSGRVDSWSQVDGDSHRIQPYIPLAGDEVRSQFASQLMQGAHFTTNAVLAPSPHAMLEAVAEDEGGIGLLPISAMHPSVKAIALDDVTPDPAGPAPSDYALRLHVLAFAPQEPVGALRTWLGWVQARELATNHE